MAMNERSVSGLVLMAGQAGGAPVGEEMLAQVLGREKVKTVGADRAYDSDAIRAMLAVASKEAVSPPRSNRIDPPTYNKEKCKEYNKFKRIFNRLKCFRAVATRHDKLAHVFLGGISAALLAVKLST